MSQWQIKHQSASDSYESQIRQLNDMNTQTSAEVDKLYQLLELRKKEKESAQEDSIVLREDVSGLNKMNTELEAQLHALNEKYLILQGENDELVISRDTFRGQADRN